MIRRKSKETPVLSVRLAGLALCILAPCLLVLPCAAQPQAQPQPENRFLLVINTSSTMRRMTNGIADAVVGLIKSGMQGQMRDGDTFGIWTYDEKLHTDFPMKVWTKAGKDAISDNVAAFLAGTRFEKRPHLEKVLPLIRQIIGNSSVLTVIFVFDGSETMQGTGFDKDINDLHKEFGRQVRDDNVPFVTVLSAHDGKVFDYRVRTPSSISLPETAGFFKPADTNTVSPMAVKPVAPPAVAAVKPPEMHRPEIVLKPTEPPKTNPPVAVVPNPETLAPEKTVANTTPASAMVLPSVMTNVPPPAASISPQTPTNIAITPPVETPKAEVKPVVAPTTPPPAQVSMENRPVYPTETPKPPAVARSQPPPAIVVSQPTIPTKVEPTAVTPVSPAVVASPPIETKPAPVAETKKPEPATLPEARPTTVALPIAAALPPPADHLALLIIAFSLVAIAAVLIVFLLRRSRTPPSLISQSMDRPR